MAFALISGVRHFDGLRQRGAEGHEALAILAALSECVEAVFGLLDLFLRGEIDRAVVGRVDHVLADSDQRPACREVIDRPTVFRGVDDRRRVGSQPAEVLRHRQVFVDRLRVLEERAQGDRCRLLARLDELGGDLVNLLMQRVVKVVRLKEASDPVQGLVVDENGSEQGLLGFDVVRRLPETQRLVGCGLCAKLVGRKEGSVRHAREASRSSSGRSQSSGPAAHPIPIMHTGTKMRLHQCESASI